MAMINFPSTPDNNMPIINTSMAPFIDTRLNTPSDLMTPYQYLIISKCLAPFRFIIGIGGIIVNVLIIRTFIRMGLEDSVTIAFFNLAISDFLLLVVTIGHTIGMVFYAIEAEYDVIIGMDPYAIISLFIIIARLFSNSIQLLTAFLALQRCLCVTLPLHFKGMFTRYKTFVIMLCIWIFCIACNTILFSQIIYLEVPKGPNNDSAIIMHLKPAWQDMVDFFNITFGIVLNTLCQLIVFVCVFVLAHALKKSVKFRQETATIALNGTAQRGGQDSSDLTKDSSSSRKTKGPSRERQATVQVAIIATIYLITTTPYLITAFAELLVPGLGVFQRYHFLLSSYYAIKSTIEIINSAVNFFIYYKYNTKFRQCCFRKKVK